MNQFINEQIKESKNPRSMIHSFDLVLNSKKFQICKWNSWDSIPFSENEEKKINESMEKWTNGKWMIE